MGRKISARFLTMLDTSISAAYLIIMMNIVIIIVITMICDNDNDVYSPPDERLKSMVC